MDLTREQQERIAREIMGWSNSEVWWLTAQGEMPGKEGAMPDQHSPDFLWPLETAILKRFDLEWEEDIGFSLLLRGRRSGFINHPTRGDCLLDAALSLLPEVAP